MGGSDGFVHAYRPDGSELPGLAGARRRRRRCTPAGARSSRARCRTALGGAILASVAAADMDRDGVPEVVAADMEGKVYAWDDGGNLLFRRGSNIDYSGKPLQPFEDVRYVRSNPTRASDAARSTGSSAPPCWSTSTATTAAARDRGRRDGPPRLRVERRRLARAGFPVLVVDPTKVASVDSQTHAVTFNANAGEALNQGAIIDTPAVGDLTGDGHPEIVVGTNEEYATNQGNEGPLNSVDVQRRDGGAARAGRRHPLRRQPRRGPREDERARVRDPPRGRGPRRRPLPARAGR